MALTTFLCAFPMLCNIEGGCLEVGNLDTLVVIDEDAGTAVLNIGDAPGLEANWSAFQAGSEHVHVVVHHHQAAFPTLLTIDDETGRASLTYHAHPRNPLPIQSAMGTCERAL